VLQQLASQSRLLPEEGEGGRPIKPFDALFVSLKDARNDAMHTGAYARHVAADAVNLCLVLEDALMVEKQAADEARRLTVGDFMVSTPVVVQDWQTVEHARQLMLMNSFSYLPIWHDGKWWLISDMAVAKYLRPHWPAQKLLRRTLTQAQEEGLAFHRTSPVKRSDAVAGLLSKPRRPGLWLVKEKGYPPDHLVGVLSPFELM
jgi:CBS-domain-containing membrane protein